jgi:hypothetical protein
MLKNLRLGSGALLIAAILVPNLPSLALAAEAATKTSPVKVTISAQAKKLLDKHGMTLEGGILRKRGEKKGYDLATGSGEVYAIIYPKDKAALAVALYDHGRRYGALNISFYDTGPAISPLDEPEDVIAKLFPTKR